MSAVVRTHADQAPRRPETPDRWRRASERAQAAQVIVTAIDDLGTFEITSASHPGVRYTSDGVHCTCDAAWHGDPVCLHRAAVRDHRTAQHPCSLCGGTGWEHFSIWDWRNGRAMELYSMPCRCQQHPEPEPPASVALAVDPARTGLAVFDQELAAATAALAAIDDELAAYNASIDGDGAFAHRNRRRHDHLLQVREAAQLRVWDAQDELARATTAQVAA